MSEESTLKSWAALVKGGFFTEFTYEAKRRYGKSSAALDMPADSWTVEVGCGTGRYHRLLREIGYSNLVSADLTLEHILRAKEVNPKGNFVVASGERLPFKDGVFDALVSNAAIEHFSDPGLGMREFGRVTTEESRMVVTSDCFSWRVLQLLGLYNSKMPIDKTMTYRGFEQLFAQAGLHIVDADAWGVTHYLRRLARALPSMGKTLDGAMQDDHWSNRKSTSDLGVRMRMMTLDENLFVLSKQDRKSARKPQWSVPRAPLNLYDVLACPACHGSLEPPSHDKVSCSACHASYDIVEQVPVLL